MILSSKTLKKHQVTSPEMHLVLREGEQRGESLATYRTHVVFGRAAVRLSMFTKAILGEEGPRAHVALVVPLDEVRLLLSRAWGKS